MNKPLDPESAGAIDALASRLNKLMPLRVDPEQFHVERNDIVVAMRRLAKAMRGEPSRPPVQSWINPNAPEHRRGTRVHAPDAADRRRRPVVRLAPFD